MEMISMPSFPHGSLLQTMGVSKITRYVRTYCHFLYCVFLFFVQNFMFLFQLFSWTQKSE